MYIAVSFLYYVFEFDFFCYFFSFCFSSLYFICLHSFMHLPSFLFLVVFLFMYWSVFGVWNFLMQYFCLYSRIFYEFISSSALLFETYFFLYIYVFVCFSVFFFKFFNHLRKIQNHRYHHLLAQKSRANDSRVAQQIPKDKSTREINGEIIKMQKSFFLNRFFEFCFLLLKKNKLKIVVPK